MTSYRLELTGTISRLDDDGEPVAEKIPTNVHDRIFTRLADHLYHEDHAPCSEACAVDVVMAANRATGEVTVSFYIEEVED